MSHQRNQQSQLDKSVVSLLLYSWIRREQILFIMFGVRVRVRVRVRADNALDSLQNYFTLEKNPDVFFSPWNPLPVPTCYMKSAQSPKMAAYSFFSFICSMKKKILQNITKILKYTQAYKTIISGEIVGRGSVKSTKQSRQAELESYLLCVYEKLR